MQGKNQCSKCGNDYNFKQHKPIELECKHILCISCSFELYFGNQNQIKCPWDGQITTENPGLLPFHQESLENQKMQTTQCAKHGLPNSLFCKNCMLPICGSCAQWTQKHKSHVIVDVDEEIENLKAQEVAIAKQNYEKIAEVVNKHEVLINEQSNKYQQSIETYIENAEKVEQVLTQYISQQKQNQINILIQSQAEFQKQHEHSVQQTASIKQLLERIQIKDEENIGELLEFIGKMEGLEKQAQELKAKEIELQYKIDENQIQNIKQAIDQLFNIQLEEQEIAGIEIQLVQKQWQKRLKALCTFVVNSQDKKEYKLVERNFEKLNINTPKTENQWTQIEQIGEQNLIISGGNQQAKRFTIFNNGGIQEFQMNFGRKYHRTVFDHKSKIYAISGQGSKQCEVFDLVNKQFTSISDILEATEAFGAFIDQTSNIFVTGGYTSSRKDEIKVYNCENDQWAMHNCKLPTQAQSTAAYIYNQNSSLIYYNNVGDIDTLLFDFKQIVRHGEKFQGKCRVVTQPIVIETNAYQFDYNSDLFIYPLNQAKWEKIK